jgi:hypothetical protein
MIPISFDEPCDAAWVTWCGKGAEAVADLLLAVAAGGTPSINEKLYKAQRSRIETFFRTKCVYCESDIGVSQPGDIEHFRPKGEVRGGDGEIVRDDQGIEHPGYWWLAYNWRNLLLACSLCNTRRGKFGKGSYFPLKNEATRAFRPTDVEGEALLIHPCERDPTPHFVFHPNGCIAGVTDEGKVCVELLGLNREPLQSARQSTYLQAQALFRAFILVEEASPTAETLKKEINAWQCGAKAYAAVARLALAALRKLFNQRLGETQ